MDPTVWLPAAIDSLKIIQRVIRESNRPIEEKLDIIYAHACEVEGILKSVQITEAITEEEL